MKITMWYFYLIFICHIRRVLYLKLTMSAAAGIPSESDIPAARFRSAVVTSGFSMIAV